LDSGQRFCDLCGARIAPGEPFVTRQFDEDTAQAFREGMGDDLRHPLAFGAEPDEALRIAVDFCGTCQAAQEMSSYIH